MPRRRAECSQFLGSSDAAHLERTIRGTIRLAKIIPDGAMVTGCYSFTGKPKRVTYTYIEA
jgi:hypothetical protein